MTFIALQQYGMNNSFANTFTKTMHTLDLITYLESLPESYAEINRLSSLYQFISTRSKYNKNYSIHTFIEEINLMREKNIAISADPIDINIENKINILTAHSSKGLEFDHVFIYQSIENKLEVLVKQSHFLH
jgi:DNA helicase-2/ATP-dependent DNA helicase PcrA